MPTRLKGKRLIVPIAICAVLISLMMGFIVSSRLKINPAIRVLGKEVDEESKKNLLKDSQVFVQLAEKLKPVTVNISTTKIIKKRRKPFIHPFRKDDTFKDSFGDDFF